MKRFVFLALALVFFGCDEKTSLPLSDEKLVAALSDVHIAENSVLHLKSKDKDSVLNVYYEQICEIHEIDRADLDTCIARLKREPDLAFGYYEKVYEELEKLNLTKR